MHTLKRNLGSIGGLLESWDIRGPLKFMNHDYIDILKPDGSVSMRFHALSAGVNARGRLEVGTGKRLFVMVTDGNNVRFDQDPIFRNDPHPSDSAVFSRALEGVDDKDIWGIPYSAITFQGSKREILTLIEPVLRASIMLNDRKLEYNFFNQNGNMVHTFFRSIIETAALRTGLNIKVPDFNPSGLDSHELESDLKVEGDFSVREDWNSTGQLVSHIDGLFETIGKQIQQFEDVHSQAKGMTRRALLIPG